MRVFLSSAYEDLIDYRAKAASALERLGQQGVGVPYTMIAAFWRFLKREKVSPPPRRSYDAFISYSRTASEPLAGAIERGLQRIAGPWYRSVACGSFVTGPASAQRPTSAECCSSMCGDRTSWS